MKKKKEEIINWVKENKKKLIIAGVSVAFIITTILACKNLDEIEEVFKSLKKSVEQASEKITTAEKIKTHSLQRYSKVYELKDDAIVKNHSAHTVREHLRNLHEGWNASEWKKALAAERGIKLQPGQTLVNSYSTGG